MGVWISRGNFISLLYKACAVSLYTILVRKIGGHFVTLFFNMSQNDLKLPNRILLIFSAIHIKSFAFRFATPKFPHNAHSTYFFLIYGYLYLQKPGPFIHYLAKINKELPDTYAALGGDENAQLPDKLFNEAIRVIKDDISKGKLNLNKYL